MASTDKMAYNEKVETFRDEEYPMMKGKTYLDHGGTTIYCKSLIDAFSQKMLGNLYGNPHSASQPAELSGNEVDNVREQALRFFGADPFNFDLVFVANTTAAVKLVMDSFRDISGDSEGFWYGYHRDAHTSIVGVREGSAKHKCFHDDREVEDWLNGYLPEGPNPRQLGLFSYPGQSNMTGRRLPKSWYGKLRHSPYPHHQNTYTLFDAAALATTASLESVFADPETAPDFTALSFYKIFGFPDLGALIIRKDSGHILTWRKYFGGGTVDMVTVLDQQWHYNKKTSLHSALEDGTLPFHNIMALGCAIDVHNKLYGSMKDISRHTCFLINRMYHGLMSLKHANGRNVCVVYNEEGNEFNNSDTQGGTIAFNVMRSNATFLSYSDIERQANERDVFVRAGGLCNAGGIAGYLNLTPWQMKRAWSAGLKCGGRDGLEIISGKPTGVVRASLGAMSTLEDVDIFLTFMAETFVDTKLPILVETLAADGPVFPTASMSARPASIQVFPPRSAITARKTSQSLDIRPRSMTPAGRVPKAPYPQSDHSVDYSIPHRTRSYSEEVAEMGFAAGHGGASTPHKQIAWSGRTVAVPDNLTDYVIGADGLGKGKEYVGLGSAAVSIVVPDTVGEETEVDETLIKNKIVKPAEPALVQAKVAAAIKEVKLEKKKRGMKKFWKKMAVAA